MAVFLILEALRNQIDLALIVPVFTVIAIWVSVRISSHQRSASSFDVMTQLLEVFNDKETVHARRRLASMHLSQSKKFDKRALIVMNSIEHICTSLRRGSVDKWTLWASSSGDQIFSYVVYLEDFIWRMRKDDPTYFEDSIWFVKKWSRRTWRRKKFNIVMDNIYRSRVRRSHKRHEKLVKDSINKDCY